MLPAEYPVTTNHAGQYTPRAPPKSAGIQSLTATDKTISIITAKEDKRTYRIETSCAYWYVPFRATDRPVAR
jgi:hypothetical protein